ncbi:GNAT family N-acetyltransferase [Citrobacter koseri]|uniref:GNAT family N-acetyltransferase n=1 Tax=Citrobacter koseri TaxID=545 RepID=UPI001D205D97|nr:GNAT family N-acetyltransferase [Citrobacter koseri]CAG0253528.1 hypothetical protein AN2353V1_2204 [Citrobacter koseri]CAH6066538.1 hypothetical protein AN2353V1_2204 [Citrobacter koseri]
MNLTIRYAVPADTPILQTLGKSSYYHHFKELWDCPVELRQFINSEYAPDQLENSLNDPSVTWLIAESDKPVGFAKISWDRPVSGGNHSGALLNKLYFAPGETGKGYGRILFENSQRLSKKACYMYSENVFRHRGKCRRCETEPQNQRSRAGESAFRDHSGQHKDDYKTTDSPFILFSTHNVYYVKLNL